MQRTISTYTKAGATVSAIIAVAAMILTIHAVGVSAADGSSINNTVRTPSQQTLQSQAATDLRAGLRTLLREHVSTNLVVNRSIAGGASQSEIDSGVTAQIANSDALSAAIASLYGQQAGNEFSDMFREHIDESNAFAAAVAAGDESAKAEANLELREYLLEISDFFSGAIPGLPSETVYGLLLEHENLMNQSTEAFKDRNFGQSRKIEQQALKQITVVADALAANIIRTQPDKFL